MSISESKKLRVRVSLMALKGFLRMLVFNLLLRKFFHSVALCIVILVVDVLLKPLCLSVKCLLGMLHSCLITIV